MKAAGGDQGTAAGVICQTDKHISAIATVSVSSTAADGDSNLMARAEIDPGPMELLMIDGEGC